MRTARWLLVALLWTAIPTQSAAQDKEDVKEDAKDFVQDVLMAVFGPNWNLSIHGGASQYGRFALQRAALPGGVGDGERELTTATGFNVGAAAGVDILLRTGIRLTYSFSSTDLEYNTDMGNGSSQLDVSDVGGLQSHLASFEVIRYMLPAEAKITPYFSAGILGNWWVLDRQTALAVASGGTTQFRIGPLVSFGMQFKVADHVDVRTELATTNAGNPFTGRDSFRAPGGTKVDEPSRVGRMDFRLALQYSFGKPKADLDRAKQDVAAIVGSKLDEALALLREVRAALGETAVGEELQAELETIRAQQKSPKPKLELLKGALQSAKRIAESAAAGGTLGQTLRERVSNFDWTSVI